MQSSRSMTAVAAWRWLIPLAVLLIFTAFCISPAPAWAQGVAITPATASSDNLFVQWNTGDPERIDAIKWNSAGLTGGEPNLTATGTTGSPPCHAGDVEYFGNSWSPPDPQFGGKVLVGAGTTGTREPGPDNKVLIDSTSTGCAPSSAGVAVETIYKFWQGGRPINRMKVTRSLTFSTAFGHDVRPYIPRLYPVSGFRQVLHPTADGTSVATRSVGGGSCPSGCIVTDWNGNDAANGWFAIHNPASGQGLIVKRTPSTFAVALWIDWDGASFTNASSVLALSPSGGFTGTMTEEQHLCFYDSSIWTPSLTLPQGC